MDVRFPKNRMCPSSPMGACLLPSRRERALRSSTYTQTLGGATSRRGMFWGAAEAIPAALRWIEWV